MDKRALPKGDIFPPEHPQQLPRGLGGTGMRHQELEAQRKDEERQEEEITEELKRFLMQEMARGFYLRRHC